MKQILLAFALFWTILPVWAQEDESVDILFSSGFTGIDLQDESEIFSSDRDFTSRFRLRSNSLYFFNPAVRKYTEAGFVEMGLKGVNYFQSDGTIQFRGLDSIGNVAFDSTSSTSALGVSGSLYLGKSVTMAKVGDRFRFYLGVEEGLRYEYLKLSQIKDDSSNETTYLGASTTSLTTTLIPRVSHKITSYLRLEAALPIRVFSFDFTRAFEYDVGSNLSSNQGAFIMTSPWKVGFQVSLALQLK